MYMFPLKNLARKGLSKSRKDTHSFAVLCSILAIGLSCHTLKRQYHLDEIFSLAEMKTDEMTSSSATIGKNSTKMKIFRFSVGQ